jgi:hypothetical protein
VKGVFLCALPVPLASIIQASTLYVLPDSIEAGSRMWVGIGSVFAGSTFVLAYATSAGAILASQFGIPFCPDTGGVSCGAF